MFLAILHLRAQDIPEAVLQVFKDAKLNQVEALEKYLSLINGSWPEQSEPLSYFAANAPDALALAMPNLRQAARAHARKELLKPSNDSPIVIEALLNLLQLYSLSRADTDYFDWEKATGIDPIRESLAKGVEAKSGVSLNDVDIKDPNQLDAYIQTVRKLIRREGDILQRSAETETVERLAQYLLSPNAYDKVFSLSKLENSKDGNAGGQLATFLKHQLSKTNGVYPEIDDVFVLVRTIRALEKINGQPFPGRRPVTRTQWVDFVSNIDVNGRWSSKVNQ
jgi:hypothetical protein